MERANIYNKKGHYPCRKSSDAGKLLEGGTIEGDRDPSSEIGSDGFTKLLYRWRKLRVA